MDKTIYWSWQYSSDKHINAEDNVANTKLILRGSGGTLEEPFQLFITFV